jgi:hypothetical protein
MHLNFRLLILNSNFCRQKSDKWIFLGSTGFAFGYSILGGHDTEAGMLIVVICGLMTILLWNWGKRKNR